ncbi:MAG: c-type cytochrome [Gammaproteobacteria bacterium]|nr:c-type cytochrome [Gammaproteobacteria bacterium]MBT4607884.1 c-type cytochrome [Thiotrichales bacterium]MBT3472053.1 c-type cytochrome [Gammaproteobacteria bacterium]MBT3967316.1 c-type cytochrome [Gammaproteobacteria bacterium]MBT4080488.1 c-type cytochrome [Gammaproteobacteria bacterium]
MRHSSWWRGWLSGALLLPAVVMADAPLDDELSTAMAATPNVEAGKAVFRLCVVCHQTESWGVEDGNYPQLAGQHSSVIIKQIADIRAGNRDNPAMLVIAQEKVMGGPQAIADVTAYIQTLPMTPTPGVGPGEKLDKAERIYFRKCAECHGSNGQGDGERYFPRIQGQHYAYLLRQLNWIREGKRRNANPEMARRLNKLKPRDLTILADYVSRLKPPAEKIAPVGWKNPDF